jgi:hypothetical protein
VSYDPCVPHNAILLVHVNAILVVDPTFIAVDKNDPLALLEAMKSVVTSRCDGNIELERAQALRDWYMLTMREGEDTVEYGRRSVAKDSQAPECQRHSARYPRSNPYGSSTV